MKYLVIQGRGLGDAIITCRLIHNIKKVQPTATVEVLCRLENAEIFELEETVDYVHKTSFPVNVHGFLNIIRSILKTLRALIHLPSYDIVIDPVGARQEFFIGSIIRARKFITARHFKENPLHLMHNAKPRKIQNDSPSPLSYYQFIDRLAVECVESGVSPQIMPASLGNSGTDLQVEYVNEPILIGIHPFGGVRWRSLSDQQVIQLAQRLLSFNHYRLVIFAAPNDRARLNEVIEALRAAHNVEFKFLGIRDFISALNLLSVLIGTDSFAVHAATAIGLNTVFINSANDWRIWKPPQAKLIIGRGEQCRWYPCFNHPRCIGQDGEFACILSVDIEDVVNEVINMCHWGGSNVQ